MQMDVVSDVNTVIDMETNIESVQSRTAKGHFWR